MRRKTLEALIAQVQSPTSNLSSPTPPTKPTQTSDDLLTMMKMMTEMFQGFQKETRELVLDILQGRGQTLTSPQVISQIDNVTLTNYDDDSMIPLPPGIEAVMAREVEETQQAALLRERAALQNRLAELTEERNRLYESEDSSLPFSDNSNDPQTIDATGQH